MTKLNLAEREVWLLPFGKLLDLIELHRQYTGQSKPYREYTIDDVMPSDLI